MFREHGDLANAARWPGEARGLLEHLLIMNRVSVRFDLEHQFEFCRASNWKVSRLCTVEDAAAAAACRRRRVRHSGFRDRSPRDVKANAPKL
jgi:hypothetical protein